MNPHVICPIDPDAILASLFEGEAVSCETYATVACAIIATQPRHWLGLDYQIECLDHAVRSGIVFG
ncbi:hypothetical protein V5F77_04300 [Xanthobacter sp. DSM 24535]|uniref:hypothetical protein n=1 Tax=Roseixanthobacter psychrophilus TaxID=3119917 RepID=UPI00372B56BF